MPNTEPPLMNRNGDYMWIDQRALRRQIGDKPVRITGPIGSAPGLYPAKFQKLNDYVVGTGPEWVDDPDGDCWAVALPSLTLTNGLYATSTQTGAFYQTKPIVTVREYIAGSGGLATINEDGTDEEDPTDTIIADEDTGITFDTTGLSAGENKLVMLAASASQMGAVTTTTQTFGGSKTFNNSVNIAGGAAPLSIGSSPQPLNFLRDTLATPTDLASGYGWKIRSSGGPFGANTAVTLFVESTGNFRYWVIGDLDGSGIPGQGFGVVRNVGLGNVLHLGLDTSFTISGVTYTFHGGILTSAV